MVYLMLKNTGWPSLERPAFPFAVRAISFGLDRPVAGNVGLEAGNAKAAFRLDRGARGGRAPGRIDDGLERVGIPAPISALFGTEVAHSVFAVLNDKQAERHGNLRRREADALSRQRGPHDVDQFVKSRGAEQLLRDHPRAVTKRRMADFNDLCGSHSMIEFHEPT